MNLGKKVHEHIKRHIKAALPQSHEPLWKRIFVWFFLIIVGLFLASLFLFTFLVGALSIGLPDVRDFDQLAGTESTLLFDRNGGTLYTIHGEENRKYVPLGEISPFLQKATIAIEDDGFYEHSGFDIPAISRAVLHEAFGIGSQRGGSTITQQLARNAFLTKRREYTRKLKEIILAVRLERAYDKNKILELYLNRIPYGNNAYGAEMAAKMYFGKSAKFLTLSESAVLASLPQAPTYYSPYGANAYSRLDAELNVSAADGKMPETIQDLKESDYTTGLIGRTISFSPNDNLFIPGRANVVLKRMTDVGFITEEEKNQANAELERMSFPKHKEAIRAPHFVFYVRTLLEEMLGKDVVAQGGLQVYTTLDPDLQAKAEQIVEEQINTSKELHGTTNAALFSMDAKTGQVLAMVGAADYFDEAAHGNVNHVFARRQPGSSFKPIVYAKAFLNGYSPATVIYDTPTNFGNNYIPQNYEGGFRGPMSIRNALGQSRNIPALKAYFLAGQQKEIIDLASKLGISTLNPDGDYGPPLAIGAGEVTLADMVQAFSVFANTGVKRNHFSILKIVDREGKVLYEHNPQEIVEETVIEPQAAYLINSVLSDKSVYLGPRLNVPGHTTAAKTGTSNKEITPVKILPSNLWTIGYTPSIVTGVWAGNSDGSPMKNNADGYNVAAPVWAKFMSEALKDKPNEAFPVPPGIRNVTISKASGKLPSEQTPDYARGSEVFSSFSVPAEYDDIYTMVSVNDLDNLLPNEYTPQEYVKQKLFMNHHDPILEYPSWLAGIRRWVQDRRGNDPSMPDFPPTETTRVFTAETANSKPTISIISPMDASLISTDRIEVQVRVQAPNGVEKVLFFLDDRHTPNATEREFPYMGAIRFTHVRPGAHTITAKVYDNIGYIGEAKINIVYEAGEELPVDQTVEIVPEMGE